MISSLWRLLLPVEAQPLQSDNVSMPQSDPGQTNRDSDHSLQKSGNEGGSREPETVPLGLREASCCRRTSARTEHSAQGAQECGSDACECKESSAALQTLGHEHVRTGKILFGSQKGTSSRLARQLAEQAAAQGVQLSVLDMGAFEVEQLWKEPLVIIVTSTYEDGTPPQNAR
jgi:hypothetical protein